MAGAVLSKGMRVGLPQPVRAGLPGALETQTREGLTCVPVDLEGNVRPKIILKSSPLSCAEC